MKLIFLSSLVPVDAPKSGYDIANRAIVDGLLALGIDLQIVGFLTPGEVAAYPDRTMVLDELEVTNTRVSKLQKASWLLRAFQENQTVSSVKMLATKPELIKSTLDRFRPFDGLILNSVQMAGAFEDLFADDPSIFIAHNVEAYSAKKNADAAGNMISAILFNREAKLLKQLEQRLCDRASHIWTLSDQDRFDLGVEDKSNTLPLITSASGGTTVKNNPAIKYDVGSIGSWSWAANRQGLDWFLSNVAPELPEDSRIAIAGNIGAISQGQSQNIEFLGRVEDAKDFCQSCAVIPLFSQEGTGVQLKTIETFELGLPCVATSNALRGISHIPENCVRADTAEEFVAALEKQVADVKAGKVGRLDGNAFHSNQRTALLSGLSEGLQRAGFEIEPEAAAS